MSAESSAPPAVDYYFGPFRFDGRLRGLYKDEQLVVLTPKAADTLVALLERAGRIIEKDELFRAVWGDIVVSDDSLAQNISTVRRVLGDDANRPRFIATVPRHGYRFVAPVRVADATSTADAIEVVAEEPLRLPHAISIDNRNRNTLLIALTALVAAIAGALAPRLSVNDAAPTVVQFTVDAPEHSRFAVAGGMLALSPNGEYLAFTAVDDTGSASLWLRPLASVVSRVVAGTHGAEHPFWSADSRTIAFFSERRLKAVDVASGAVRVIASLASPRSLGGTWNRSGQILFSVPNNGMYVVAASGGVPEALPYADCCGAWPSFLPDGRHFLYTVSSANPSASGIYVGEVGNPNGRRLLDAVSSSTWVSPGFVSFARAGTLYLQRFDDRRMRLTGAPVPVSDSVAYNVRTGRVLAATSAAGVIAFRKPLLSELVWVDRAGTLESVAASPGLYAKFAIAPDGRRVVAARLDPRSGTSDVWVFEAGREVRVTDNPGWDGDPVWSADGRYVVYSSQRGGRWRIYRRAATAVGAEELVLDTDTPISPLQVLPSMQLVYAAQRAPAPFDVWKLERTRPTPLTHIGGYYPSDARLSPDERWLAYGLPQTAGNYWDQALYVSGRPFGDNRREIAQAASMPRWRADGQELFYLSKDSSIIAISLDPLRTPSDSAGRALFQARALPPTGISGNVYDVTPDGQGFLLKREVGSSPIHVVLSWNAGGGR